MLQVKERHLYHNTFARDNIFLRVLHCHYNFEKCGIYIRKGEIFTM